MKNGQFWYDTDGNIIHAHGGRILKVDDYSKCHISSTAKVHNSRFRQVD